MPYRNQEDTCPLCGSQNIEYPNGAELYDNAVAYPSNCKKCGCTWVAWYRLVYDENTDVMDAHGNEIDI